MQDTDGAQEYHSALAIIVVALPRPERDYLAPPRDASLLSSPHLGEVTFCAFPSLQIIARQ